MQLIFRKSFDKDIDKIQDLSLLRKVQTMIQELKQSKIPRDITNLKKLKTKGNYYRIRLGDYRAGLSINGDEVTLIR
ncbi:MAG: type II toxin-antitoxin system RelE family toxin [Microcystaceae cyanobacterium]